MQSNKLKLIFILILAVLLFSCSKEVKEPAEEKTVAESKPVENKIEEQKSEPPAPQKTAEQLEAEEKYKKSKEYEEKLKQLGAELDKKESAIIAQIPVAATDADLEQKRAITGLYDHKKKVYNYTNFKEVIKEGNVYYCKQKIKSQNGGVLEYHVKFEKDRYTHKEDSYTVSTIELSSQIDIGQISEEIIETPVHGKIYDLAHDEKKDDIIKLFEEYENTHYPLYHENIDLSEKSLKDYQIKLEAVDYVKGNFTDSGYDEYFVVFCKEVPGPEYGQTVKRVRCFVVDEDKIIKDYYITVPSASFFPPHIERGGLFGLKNFGFEFSQGWVSDFNQNGKNEIYFVTHFSTGRNFLFIIEFNGEFFVTGYVYDNDYDIVGIDWYKKMIIIKDESRSGKWIDDYQWNDTLKEFILLKRKYRRD